MKRINNILIDVSNIIHAAFYISIQNSGEKLDGNQDFLRHLVLSNILNFKNMFKVPPQNVFICMDHKENWRKEVFEYYKASRKIGREKSNVDFKILYKFMDDLYDDLVKYFPFKTLKMAGLEADDIIAILAKRLNSYEETFVIISSDKDFYQLHGYKNFMFQYNQIKKERIVIKNPKNELICKILNGDSGDGVPNVKSKDDIFMIEGERQKSVGRKLAEKLITENNVEGWIKENNLAKNWNRNNRLINLRKIPENLVESFINIYVIYEVSKNKMGLINYLENNRLTKLVYRIEEFYIK